jgi:hypothetical protein
MKAKYPADSLLGILGRGLPPMYTYPVLSIPALSILQSSYAISKVFFTQKLLAGAIRQQLSDPGLRDCVHNVVHIGLEDRTCPIPYPCCTLLACEVGLADTEGNYSSCTQMRFLG